MRGPIVPLVSGSNEASRRCRFAVEVAVPIAFLDGQLRMPAVGIVDRTKVARLRGDLLDILLAGDVAAYRGGPSSCSCDMLLWRLRESDIF